MKQLLKETIKDLVDEKLLLEVNEFIDYIKKYDEQMNKMEITFTAEDMNNYMEELFKS